MINVKDRKIHLNFNDQIMAVYLILMKNIRVQIVFTVLQTFLMVNFDSESMMG